MIKILPLLILLIVTIQFVAPITHAQSASSSASLNESTSSEIKSLKDQVEHLRGENYEQAIRSSSDAADKADRLINWMAALATIIGAIIVVVSFVIGKDLKEKLNELRTHVQVAKQNAELIANLAEQAHAKGEVLGKEFDKIKLAETKLAESTTKNNTLSNELSSLVSDARGTISEIQSLKNQANYISNATAFSPSPSLSSSASPAQYINYPPLPAFSDKKCEKCGKYIVFGNALLGESYCKDCK